LEVTVHGARGSSAVAGPQFERYGGQTTCYSSMLPGGRRLILDCGSGLLHLWNELMAAGNGDEPFEATVLLSHFHWDHIQGLLSFPPLYRDSTRLHFIAAPPAGMTIEEALDGPIRPPWFPVRFREVAAHVTYEPLGEHAVRVGDIEVASVSLRHPGGVRAYRLNCTSGSLVLATDIEAGDPERDEALRVFAADADMLIHDAQHTPEEWAGPRSGWGHSTWEHATSVARDAGVRQLLLTSHDPSRDDDGVEDILRLARARFAHTDAASAGRVIEV
jgi:phosphoribosyl 1,2-cyclic phosphodiesterase